MSPNLLRPVLEGSKIFQAGDIFVKPLVYWTHFFLNSTIFSRPQIDVIGSRIRDLAETKYG